MKITARPRVIIRRCPSYDTERIRTIIREGLGRARSAAATGAR
jgi:hypothetical protein